MLDGNDVPDGVYRFTNDATVSDAPGHTFTHGALHVRLGFDQVPRGPRAAVAPRAEAADLEGVGRTPPVPPYRAQLALLVSEPPEGDAWLHEVKYDGYRIGCEVARGRVRLWSRRGKEWTAAFPEVAAAAARLPVRSALLDGEVAAVLPDGRTSFQLLQNAFSAGPRPPLAYFVFDLLHLDGEDLARRPLLERKAALARLVAGAPPVVRCSSHVAGGGAAVFREACRLRLEGIVSKQAQGPYRPGRGGGWVKTKCVLRQELVVGGFTEPEGAARDGLGALLVGAHEGAGGPLRFAGKVGTGFTNAVARALRARLDRLRTEACPFVPRPPGWLGRNARWVRPVLVCEVEFTEWTADGKVRHPSFQGLREDKPAGEVVREVATATATPTPTPTPTPTSTSTSTKTKTRTKTKTKTKLPEVHAGGVRISSHSRLVYPDVGLTKLDVARYYEEVSAAILPHLRGRPLTLFHCPEGLAGECRFMKHSKVWAPEAVRRVRIPEKTKIGEYLVIDGEAALLSVVQMDVLELHTWNSTVDRLEEPDRVVLDLDPGPLVPWPEVVRAARLTRDALAALGLAAFVKTTGGTGVHVVVPIEPAPWQAALAFARGLAAALERHDPRRLTTAFARAGREARILLDYLRNNRTNTSVAAFSTRARPGAPVSVPIAWDELGARLRPDRFTLRTVPRRLRALRADPWAGYAAARRPLAPGGADAHL